MDWTVSRPREQLTLEIVGTRLVISGDSLVEIGQSVEPLPDELQSYERLESDIVTKYWDEDFDSRRQVTVYQPSDPEQTCISLVHVVRDTMIVHQRSADVRRFPSDVAFLCRLALKVHARHLIVTFGSVHFILEEADVPSL